MNSLIAWIRSEPVMTSEIVRQVLIVLSVFGVAMTGDQRLALLSLVSLLLAAVARQNVKPTA